MHVGIIMDGNRRYGIKTHRDAVMGHEEGAKNLLRCINWCAEDETIRMLTVFAFSTENWNRADDELSSLFELFKKYSNPSDICTDITLKFISTDSQKLPPSVNASFATCERQLNGTKLHVNVCVSYGGRGEIVNATKQIAKKVLSGELSIDEINERVLARNMLCDTNVDLLIRTSGEKRISNFLLWSIAYAELVFVDKLWPELTRDDFYEVIREFYERNRRFGY